MSARSCLLCGKPLSRIWVGAASEFCSREHRNQYRLRQGMERLQEANKVASVMRRREQLRPLTHGRQPNPASPAPQGFYDGRFAPAFQPAMPSRFSLPCAAPRTIAGTNGFMAPKCAAVPGAAQPVAAPRQGPVPIHPPAFLPLQRIQPRVRISLAPPTGERAAALPAPERPREFAMVQPSGRPAIPELRKPVRPEVHLAAPRGNVGVAPPVPVQGNALRVSSACGFRARAPRLPFRRVLRPIVGTLRRTEKPQTRSSNPGKAAARACDAVSRPSAAICYPPAPEPAASALRFVSSAVGLAKLPARHGESPEPHCIPGSWNESNDNIALRAPVFRHWKPCRTEPLPPVASKPMAVSGRGFSRYTLAPFVPPDVPFGFTGYAGQNGSKD